MGRRGQVVLGPRAINLLTLGLAPLPTLLILAMAMGVGVYTSPKPLAWLSNNQAAVTFWPDDAEYDLSALAESLYCYQVQDIELNDVTRNIYENNREKIIFLWYDDNGILLR